MDTRRYRVLCVDDNEFVCEAIQRRLSREPEFCCVGVLPTADDLVNEVVRSDVDLVVLDMNMPGKDPLEAVRELALRCPGVKAVALSGQIQDGLISRALEAGVCGYISKSEEPAVLVDCLRFAIAGDLVLSPEVRRYFSWSENHRGSHAPSEKNGHGAPIACHPRDAVAS